MNGEHFFLHSADTSPPSCPLNYWLAQRMNIILNKSLHSFCGKPSKWNEYFQVTLFKIGSSELKHTLHHNSRLNCLCNALCPPWCRLDLNSLRLMETWRFKNGFVLGCITSGHYNTNVVKPNLSNMARPNFIIFAPWMVTIFSFHWY